MGILTRSAATDAAGIESGRFAIAGTATFTDVVLQADIKWSTPDSTSVYQGVVLYVDANNWLAAVVKLAPGDNPRLYVFKRVGGGTPTAIGMEPSAPPRPANVWHTLRLQRRASGAWAVWLFPNTAGPGDMLLQGQDSALATGGAIASAKLGLIDRSGSGD